MKYRKKPIIVEAFRFGFDPMEDWAWSLRNTYIHFIYGANDSTACQALIETLEGTMTANYGDYIIMGVAGELYPCKSDIFELTYEKLDDNQ